MKKIITSNVLDPSVLQPFTAQSLRFLQESKEDDVAALIKALVISNLGSYSLTTPYVISGCVYDNTSLYGVTAGEIFYGGKYYQTTALANNTSTNIPRFVLTGTPDVNADPLTFSDSSVFNVHTIYTYVATDSATLGDFNATQLVSVYGSGKITFNVNPADQNTSSTSYVDLATAVYTTPNDGITRNWLLLYNGVLSKATSGGDGARVEFYNNTTAAQIINTKTYLAVNATSVDLMELNISLQKVISLAPNTTVKVRFFSISGGTGVTLANNDFSIIEI